MFSPSPSLQSSIHFLSIAPTLLHPHPPHQLFLRGDRIGETLPPLLTGGPQTPPGADKDSTPEEIVLQGQTVEAPAVGRRVNPLQTGAFREEAELAGRGRLRSFGHQIPKSVTGPGSIRQGLFLQEYGFSGLFRRSRDWGGEERSGRTWDQRKQGVTL
ncbi:hypothetical protein [Gluconobacter cerinus]